MSLIMKVLVQHYFELGSEWLLKKKKERKPVLGDILVVGTKSEEPSFLGEIHFLSKQSA